MHTLSSARRTCMASSSAVECTATEGMPSSLHARSTRNAISPRFAIRILSNISASCSGGCGASDTPTSLDDHQRFAELDRLAVLDQNLDDRPRARRGNLVHGLHRFDDEERVAGLHAAADFDEGFRARLGSDISGADHGRGDDARMLGGIEWRGLARGQRRVGGSGGRARWRRRLRLARDPHALTFALELDLAQPGFVEQARELAHEVGIDRGFAFVLALALAGHGFELLRRAPISAANPSIASA